MFISKARLYRTDAPRLTVILPGKLDEASEGRDGNLRLQAYQLHTPSLCRRPQSLVRRQIRSSTDCGKTDLIKNRAKSGSQNARGLGTVSFALYPIFSQQQSIISHITRDSHFHRNQSVQSVTPPVLFQAPIQRSRLLDNGLRWRLQLRPSFHQQSTRRRPVCLSTVYQQQEGRGHHLKEKDQRTAVVMRVSLQLCWV